METKDKKVKTSFMNELCREFTWYKDTFEELVQKACDDFFDPGFEFKMVGLSENMNVLTQNVSFFVTKVSLDPKNDVFIRISQNAIMVILDKILGKSAKKFELSNISDLEAKIITTFNEFLYDRIKHNINKDKLEKYPVTVNVSYFVRNMSSDESARFVISMPKSTLAPELLPNLPEELQINDMVFKNSPIEVNIRVGTTDFAVNDVKNLDVGDIIVFDNSNSREMILITDNIIQPFAVKPHSEIILPIDDDEEEDSIAQEEEIYDNDNKEANNKRGKYDRRRGRYNRRKPRYNREHGSDTAEASSQPQAAPKEEQAPKKTWWKKLLG